MKSLVRRIGIAAGLLLTAGVPQARAQVTSAVQFTTSFPFAVGYATVPAGTYTIRRDDDDPSILLLTGEHVGVLFLTDNIESRDAAAKTEIVFDRYGDGYVLKDIWMEGSTTGAEAMRAEAERHVAKHADAKSNYRVAALRVDTSKDN
jgi:hypothetical protein